MSSTASPRVELYVRSLASRTGRRERIIERLRDLEAAGAVGSVEVTIWGEAVALSSPATETDRGRQLLDAVGRFQEWADDAGVSLDCVFRNCRTESTITGTTYATLRLPTAAMVEYDEGDIVAVTPHRRDRGVRTIEDRLERLTGETLSTDDPGVVGH